MFRSQKKNVTIQALIMISIVSIGIYGTITLALIPFFNDLPETLELVFSHFPFTGIFPSIDSLRHYVGALFDILISGLVFFYAFHILLDFNSKLKETPHVAKQESKYIQRLSLNFRLQHIALIITFTICAITGFALENYNSWGSIVVSFLGGPEGRRIVHLGSGFAMGGISAYHILYYGYRYFKEGRKPISMMISKKDMMDLIQNFKYFLNINNLYATKKPKFGRYDYIQKFDYWGVLWGMIILGIPGVILWYLGLSAGDFAATKDPRFLLAWTFHEREALLAVVTLFMLHFYYSHLSPHTFPMNRMWITGKISEEEMIRDHPLEYKAILSKMPIEKAIEKRIPKQSKYKKE